MASTQDDSSPFLNDLNEAQRKAVTASIRDHVQILAGPGTGKTKCMASRIAWLLQQGILPEKIVALTFTNVAAKELISRTGLYIGDADKAKHIRAGTFHSLCAKLLYKCHQLVGLKKSFSIADEKVKSRTLMKVLNSESFAAAVALLGYSRIGKSKGWASKNVKEGNWNTSRVGKEISLLKNKGYTIDDWPGIKKGNKFLVAAYRHYTDLLREANLLDFDDLLIFGNQLLQNHPNVINIDCVLVDEYQDTNEVQFKFMCALAREPRGLTIVGDPDQSIYAFRGACPTNFGKMVEEFPDTKVFYLETNYRSFQQILNLSMQLMALSTKREHASRTLKSYQETLPGGLPQLCAFRSENTEYGAIGRQINYLADVHKSILQYKDIAILFRYRKQMAAMEPVLLRFNIPYNILGGTNFWETYEVNIIFNYLKVINSTFSDDAVIETINVPPRSIGPKALELLELSDKTYRNGFSKLLALHEKKDLKALGKLSAPARTGISQYVQLILDCRALLKKSNTTRDVLNVVRKIVKDTNLMPHFLSHTMKDEKRIRRNLKILKMMILQMDIPHTGMEEEDEIVDEQLAEESSGNESEQDGLVLPAIPDYDSDPENEDDVENEDAVGRLEFYPPYIKKHCLQRFLKEMMLNQTAPDEVVAGKKVKRKAPKNSVVLSTVHGAKGLEWPVVFLPMLNETKIYGKDYDEERRVLFVAMTRAAGLLYLSYNLTPDSDWNTHTSFRDEFLTDKLSEVCDMRKAFKQIKPADMVAIGKLIGINNPAVSNETETNGSSAVAQKPDSKEESEGTKLFKKNGFSSGLAMLEKESASAGRQQDFDSRKKLKTKRGRKPSVSKIPAKEDEDISILSVRKHKSFEDNIPDERISQRVKKQKF